MGGDFGPKVIVPAALRALEKHPELRLILVGNEEAIKNHLKTAPQSERLEIYPASEVVEMDELPSHALRTKKDSSMRVAINLVKNGTARACVSAGNTGALMATARFVLKMLPGIDRPAIMAALPTKRTDREVWVLDLGANVDSSAENLFQFAVMGSVAVSAINNIDKPKVALLNIGEEEIKGNEQVKQTAQRLLDSQYVNYVGYIEADGVFSGNVDVVVCDGFVGNVALKAAEGIARLLNYHLKLAFMSTLYGRIVGFFAKPLLKNMRRELDPARRNGASLLGLQGIVIKSHGGANIVAFVNAIEEALREVEHNVPDRISREVKMILNHSTPSSPETPSDSEV